jgi:TPR repeat protein
MSKTHPGIQKLIKDAENGHTNAQYELGVCLMEGIGVPQDTEEGLARLTQAGSAKHIAAQRYLGSLYLAGQNEEESRYWFEQAALGGDVTAMHTLALIYLRGNVCNADPSIALAWLKKAAENGHTASMTRLGVICCLGIGVNKDYAEAVKWFRNAAQKGDPNAQMLLASAYLTGCGVSANETDATYWFKQVMLTFPDENAMLTMADTVNDGTLMPKSKVAAYVILGLHGANFPSTQVDTSTLASTMTASELNQAKRILANTQPSSADQCLLRH